MKIKIKLCATCFEKFNRIFYLEAIQENNPVPDRCRMCSFVGWIDSYEYDTKKRRYEDEA